MTKVKALLQGGTRNRHMPCDQAAYCISHWHMARVLLRIEKALRLARGSQIGGGDDPAENGLAMWKRAICLLALARGVAIGCSLAYTSPYVFVTETFLCCQEFPEKCYQGIHESM